MGRSTRSSSRKPRASPASSSVRQSSKSRTRRTTRSATRSAGASEEPTKPSAQSLRQFVEPANMDEDEDDMYGTEEAGAHAQSPLASVQASAPPAAEQQQSMKQEAAAEDDDEDDDDDDDDDSDDDIEIITERKPGEPPEPQNHQKPPSAAVKIEAPRSGTPAIPQISTPNQNAATAAVPIGRVASPASGRPGSSYPEVKSSTLDLDANPTLGATGKPILSTDMDADFAADAAPWRRPGSDQTDYYNYGFDEGTWAAYCIKQRQNRGEVAEDRKRMEQLGAMMGGGSMPFGGMMGGMDASGAGGMPMPSMEQMQQMMSMMGGGMPGMPGMDAGMGQMQNQGFQNQGGYGGGRNQGGRGKRW